MAIKEQLQIALDWENAPSPKPALECRLKNEHLDEWSECSSPTWDFAHWEYKLAPEEYWIVKVSSYDAVKVEVFFSKDFAEQYLFKVSPCCEVKLIHVQEVK